jgi:PAS domain S-box-containing protein
VLLNSRTTRLLIEAAEDAGFPRASLIEPLGMKESELVDEDVKVEWKTLTLLLGQLSRLVDGDVERLRDVGRRMARAPSYAPLRRLSRAVLSVRRLYDVATRFAIPANFPHLRVTAQFTDGLMRVRGEIPASYAGSTAFWNVSEGSVAQLPTLLGLPPSVIVESRVTPRTCELVVALPRSRSAMARLRRGTRAIFGARDAIAVLEELQAELTGNVEALQRAREELRVLLDQLPDPVMVHAAGTVLWANRAFLTALDYEAEDVFEKPLADVVVGSSGCILEPALRTVGSPGHRVLSELALRTRAGGQLVLEVAPSQSVVFDGISARLVVGRDVTERNRMQQNLIIADRLASIGLLAAGVAHEVNNPLAYVLNNIEIARKELAVLGAGADASRHALLVALEGVDRIRAIVRDLLMLSRGKEGAVQAVDVRAVAESTLALAAHEIDRTTKLVQELRPAPAVQASDARIAQVLLNLVVNALEAMHGRPRDENELLVRVGPASDGRLLIEVSDTGTGISQVDLPRVFEPFFTTKAAGLGTGLGLSIAQRLVSEVGGEIMVSSVLGRGTTFKVLLPAAGESVQSGR